MVSCWRDEANVDFSSNAVGARAEIKNKYVLVKVQLKLYYE